MKKIIFPMITCLTLILLLTSCTPAVVDKETVKIGVILPLTGPSSDLGQYTREGILLGLEEINTNPENKYNYELIFEDSTYNPAMGVTAINKLISVDGVKYVLGAQGSSVTLAIAPVAERNKVILITPSSQSAEISKAGDYIFRTQTNTKQEVGFFSDYLLDKVGSETLDLLVVNTAYGESVISTMQTEFESRGGRIGLVQKVEAGDPDVRDPLLKIKNRNTKYVLLGTTRRQGGYILKQAQELGIKAQFFATSPIQGKELLEIGGEAAEGLVYTYPYDSTSTMPEIEIFRQKFMNKYEHENEAYSASGYDALNVLVKCIEKDKDTEKVRDCLYNTKDYHGASGLFSFDKNGDVEKEFIIKTVKNGKFVKYEEEVIEINRKPRIVDIILG
ncbi:ABC transporter substrate-binding protein [Candidatus Woesearchaeota archaeon]|nr:ABC transporter substrate-binding protein [Candidatus Woesearchaeota archaeon]